MPSVRPAAVPVLLAALAVAAPGPPDPAKYREHALTNKGDPKRGKALFADARTRCSVCHKVGGAGGEVGPDLSAVGGKFDRQHLIESVLEPSAQIVEGYRATAVTTADGRTLTGIVKGEAEGRLTLLDVDGKQHAIAADDVESRREVRVSLMPEGLWQSLSPAEFTDLIAFLESLRPAGGLTLQPGFAASAVATGITGATALDVAPDGRVFVCEQTGTLRVVKDDKLLPEPFVRLPVDSYWERGLIGVTVAPDFPRSPHVYVCYVAARPYPHHVVSRFTAAGDVAEPGSEKVLFEGDDQTKLGGKVPAGHQGGAIHFGADGKLYVALGEQTAEAPAQRLDSLLGKILRINPDGSIPDDNPFVNQTTGKYRAIWALGCRNPFTFAVQPGTGRVWANDVGGRSEEVNEIVRGGNYGWPAVDHGPTTNPKFRGPVYYYPAASVCGGAFAPAELRWPAEYRGRYFFMDFVHGWVRVLDPEKPGSAATFATGLRRPTDLRFTPDGSLYILLRDAWVIDKEFKPGTGSLLKVRYTGAKNP
jgi:putative heme-binding domain-containing protein